MKFSGRVIPGIQRGRALGFPTVNIPLNDADTSGVYAGRAVCDGKEYIAAVFANQQRNILEAYLLDFSEALYGKQIEITLEKKLRDAAEFTDDAQLSAAIAKDVEDVKAYFNL